MTNAEHYALDIAILMYGTPLVKDMMPNEIVEWLQKEYEPKADIDMEKIESIMQMDKADISKKEYTMRNGKLIEEKIRKEIKK